MKTIPTIPLKQAIELLESAAAIILPDSNSLLVYPRIDYVDDDENDEFLHIAWDDEGEEYIVDFDVHDNQTVKIKDNYLILIDTEGNENKVQLLIPATIKFKNGESYLIKIIHI